jgi:hypothetical protein
MNFPGNKRNEKKYDKHPYRRAFESEDDELTNGVKLFWGAIGLLLVALPVGHVYNQYLDNGYTRNRVGMHAGPCTDVSQVGDKLGSLASAQSYADENGGTESVCFISLEDQSDKAWYKVEIT